MINWKDGEAGSKWEEIGLDKNKGSKAVEKKADGGGVDECARVASKLPGSG